MFGGLLGAHKAPETPQLAWLLGHSLEASVLPVLHTGGLCKTPCK